MKKSMLWLLLLAVLFSACDSGTLVPIEDNLKLLYDKSSASQVVCQIFRYDGSQEINLSNDLTHNYWWPRISSDQTKFLCYRSPKYGSTQNENPATSDYGNAELMVFNIDGSNPQVLIPKGKYGWSAQGVAKFSPDGQHLIMAAHCPDSARGYFNSEWRVVITDIHGENPKIVSAKNKIYADPAWSNDGSRVVFVSPPDDKPFGTNNEFEIWVADVDYANEVLVNEQRLTYDDQYCFDPAWSHTGQYIAFTRCAFLNTPFNSEILRIRPDGADLKVLMDDNLSNAVPMWAPYDDRIYFHTLGLGTTFSLASCNADSGGDKQIHLPGGGNDRALYSTPQPYY